MKGVNKQNFAMEAGNVTSTKRFRLAFSFSMAS